MEGMSRTNALPNAASVAVCFVLVIAAVTCSGISTANSGGDQCGPFGDPPATTISSRKPLCWLGGRLMEPWNDADGTERYACVYEPKSQPENTRLPMVVYLHPSLYGAGTIHFTNLLHYQNSTSLSAAPDKTGFIVLAPQGRKTTHYYPFPDNTGVGWDNWYRQLNAAGDVKIGGTVYRENVDAATIDHFIAKERATGKVDPDRIYLTGWSNGAAMAFLYALNRPNIAAIAVYSALNPFGALEDQCVQTPVMGQPVDNGKIQIINPHAATMHVHNNCDALGICPNGEQLSDQLTALGVTVNDVVVDSIGRQVQGCMGACGGNPEGDTHIVDNPLGYSLGLANHGRWPLTWTSTMLDFLRAHPLKNR